MKTTIIFSLIMLSFLMLVEDQEDLKPKTVQESLSFEKLKGNYFSSSSVSREQLFKNVLKGGWEQLVENDDYVNTCAIRMSVALNASGLKIDKNHSDGNHKDGDGNYIAIKVPTIQTFLRSKIGESFWGMSKVPGEEFDFASHIPSGKGIILYTFNNGPANGHVDLWDGDNCQSSCPQVHRDKAATVEFWKLE